MTDDYIALLGTKGGPAIRNGSSMPTSSLYVLGGKQIVVDCGLGVTRGLVDQGMQLKDLSLIFITHLHSDHYLELGPLIHTAWTAGLATPIEVYGPRGLDLYWSGFLASMQADIDLRMEDEGRPALSDLVDIREIAPGMVFDRDGLSVSSIRTLHPPLLDCFALSFRTDRAHVVFSGDTAPFDGMSQFAQDADILVHEAMLEQALPALLARVGNGSDMLRKHLMRSHTPARDAASIANEARVGHLVLSHLIPADDPDYGIEDWRRAVAPYWNGPLTIPQDGQRIMISDEKAG